jgi:ABC-2 type transport system permease protein
MNASAATRPFPFLLLPTMWATRNRARRREKGDLVRALMFGGIGLGVIGALFFGAFWVTWQAGQYAELGDYLIRIGLSWLFLTFLSFLAFSGVVAAMSTFFLSDDLRLILAAPIASRRLFLARFARTVAQAGWMVVVFLLPVLAGIATAKCAPWSFVVTAVMTVVPFVIIPVALGSAATLFLVNVFPAKRARDILMLMGLVFAISIVVMLRFLQPERLLRVESMPEVTEFFATLQSPITPMLPSFWAGEALFAGVQGGRDLLHIATLWTTALAAIVMVGWAYERWHFAGFSKAQEGRKARFTQWKMIDRIVLLLPLASVRRHLLLKDIKVFLRDVSQWSQLLLLSALMLVYLYNFRVLDLDRIPYMSGFLKNTYAFLNLAMAGFVMATVTVRFVFPAVSAEGAAFWIIRTAPISLRDFLWAKFWSGLVPVLLLTEVLIVAGNELLNVDPFLKRMSAAAIVFMAFALVGLATGLGARYPRFAAENPTEIAGSYGGVAFMIFAVLYILVIIVLLGWPSSIYMYAQFRNRALTSGQEFFIAVSFTAAAVLSITTWLMGMRTGVTALQDMDKTPA